MLLTVVVLFSACSVTEPEETTEVASYSWPTTLNTGISYKTVPYTDGHADSVKAQFGNYVIMQSGDEYDGRMMYSLNDTTPLGNPTLATRFLPLHDTLIVKNDQIPCRYALVAPLTKGQTWVARYVDDDETTGQPSYVATVIERYDYKRVEGVTYRDVVAVEYKPRDPNNPNRSIRLYAAGVGPVQTVTLTYPLTSGSSSTALGNELIQERTVLVPRGTVQN